MQCCGPAAGAPGLRAVRGPHPLRGPPAAPALRGGVAACRPAGDGGCLPAAAPAAAPARIWRQGQHLTVYPSGYGWVTRSRSLRGSWRLQVWARAGCALSEGVELHGARKCVEPVCRSHQTMHGPCCDLQPSTELNSVIQDLGSRSTTSARTPRTSAHCTPCPPARPEHGSSMWG